MLKQVFQGIILSVQPRIRMIRSFDERSHNYLGYSLLIKGRIDNVDPEFSEEAGQEPSNWIFSVGIGKAAHQKHQFCAGNEVSGECEPVTDELLEPVEFYKVSKLKKVGYNTTHPHASPPWKDVPPELEVYRERGHRRLAARTYDSKCTTCLLLITGIQENKNTGLRRFVMALCRVTCIRLVQSGRWKAETGWCMKRTIGWMKSLRGIERWMNKYTLL